MKMGEVKRSKYALVRPIKTSFRFSSKPKLPSLTSGHGETNKDITNPSQLSDKRNLSVFQTTRLNCGFARAGQMS